MEPTNAKRIFTRAFYIVNLDKRIDELINSYLDELPEGAVVIDIKYNIFPESNNGIIESALIIYTL